MLRYSVRYSPLQAAVCDVLSHRDQDTVELLHVLL